MVTHSNKYQADESGLSTFYDAAKNYVGNKNWTKCNFSDDTFYLHWVMISSQSSAIRIRGEHHVLVRIRHEFLCFAFLVSSRKKSNIHLKFIRNVSHINWNTIVMTLLFRFIFTMRNLWRSTENEWMLKKHFKCYILCSAKSWHSL